MKPITETRPGRFSTTCACGLQLLQRPELVSVACNFKMMAKAVLVRPNVAALCMLSSKRASSSLRGVTVALAKNNNYLSNDALLYVRKSPISSFNGPVLNYRRAFCIRASTESGPIGSTLIESMEKKIKEQLNAESVVVKDTSGDGRHVSINVISSSFEGQSAVNRQRMVYKAIWEELQDIVHAVDQMTTCTPSEASGK